MSIFDPAYGPVRFVSNPVLNVDDASAWWVSQIYDPVVMVDPHDATRLLLFVSGMAAPVEAGVESIGLFEADIADPYTWTEVGQLISAGRLGSVVYTEGTFHIYYTVGTSAGELRRASTTDLDTVTLHGAVLTADGQGRDDGTAVNNPCVVKEGADWTMLYGYRNGGTILPGYRYATSSDGATWTKGGSGDLLSNPGFFSEWCSVVKVGLVYWLIYEKGPPYVICAATSLSLRSAFTNIAANPILDKSSEVGSFDRYHVATASVALIGGRWLMFYCGARDHDFPYGTNHWSLGMADYDIRGVAQRSV